MFRRAAVGGFGEAIGDLISLSVSTPSHYRRLGLLGDHPIDPADLLLLNALNQIAFLPYGYLLDKWRWSVMTGETPFESMNAKFWEYRRVGQWPPINFAFKGRSLVSHDSLQCFVLHIVLLHFSPQVLILRTVLN